MRFYLLKLPNLFFVPMTDRLSFVAVKLLGFNNANCSLYNFVVESFTSDFSHIVFHAFLKMLDLLPDLSYKAVVICHYL